LLAEIVIKWPDLEVEHWGYYELMEATISHDYERRYEDRVTENWTGKGTDLYFGTDDIPTPSPEELPPYQPSPGTIVWTEQVAELPWQEPEITPAEVTQEAGLPSETETVDISNEVYEEYQRILAVQEQELSAKEAAAKSSEIVTLSREEYEKIINAVSLNESAQHEAVKHTVVIGDTLWDIAEKYNTTISEIKALNGLTSDVIQLGQQIRVR